MGVKERLYLFILMGGAVRKMENCPLFLNNLHLNQQCLLGFILHKVC